MDRNNNFIFCLVCDWIKNNYSTNIDVNNLFLWKCVSKYSNRYIKNLERTLIPKLIIDSERTIALCEARIKQSKWRSSNALKELIPSHIKIRDREEEKLNFYNRINKK